MLLVAAVAGLTFGGLSGFAAADRPTTIPFFIEFTDVNPCTGDEVTVTMIGELIIHEHNGRFVIRIPRTITTSDGFEGRGDLTQVINGKIETFTLNDMLTHESGAKFRSHHVTVINLSTETVQVEKGDEFCVVP